MNEEIKRVLQRSVRILKSKGGMDNKEIKPVILGIEKLFRTRKNSKLSQRVKKA